MAGRLVRLGYESRERSNMPVILVDGLTIGSQLDIIFRNFDYSIFQALGSIQNDALTLIAKMFTSFGSELFVILMGVLAAVLCVPKRTRKLGIALLCAIAIGTIITNLLIKPMVVRIRPYNTLQTDPQFWGWYVGAGMLSESDYCFPSGHSTASMEMAVVLCVFHARSKKKAAKALCWVFPLAAVLCAISRVYLMVHYPSDILFGMIFGLIAGFLGLALGALIYLPFKRREERLLEAAEDDPSIEIKRPRRFGAIATTALILAVCVSYFLSFYQVMTSGGDAERCAYVKEYDCQNEAKDKYEINGQHYCKIHYEQLMESGQANN